MKRTITILCFLFTIVSFSQEIQKVKGRFFLEGKQISSRETRELLTSNTEALTLFKKSKNKESLGGFLLGFGGTLVMIDVVVGLVSDVKYPSGATYVGLASLVSSIPILSGKNKKMQNAIDTYNNGLKNAGSNGFNPELNVIANTNGYGLQLRF